MTDDAGLTAAMLPGGFRWGAVRAGIKASGSLDVAVAVATAGAVGAAMYTSNRVVAAPVTVGRRHLLATGGRVGAVLVNAGNANCATRTGDSVASATCKAAGKLLKLPPQQVLPASTGVIGVELDPGKIVNALPGSSKG